MAKKVTRLPITRVRSMPQEASQTRRRRVVGYARVSTDLEEQQSSYEAQLDYYEHYIKGREDWEFAGMYSDEGISATSTAHREGFKKMIDDALAGKFDLIITKSVSRFARNTVDSLTTVRNLKEKGIEIYFEKENIWTLDAKGELLITIMSSLAQEESRSISENTTWGRRKKFADGKVSVAYSCFLGYDKGPDGKMVINPEQAEVVKLIYRLFLDGMTVNALAKELTKRGIPTPGGKTVWSNSTVQSILKNEKYVGDALLQKEYTVDFLTKKRRVNNGEIQQYYVEDDHEAIIPRDIFDEVQVEIEKRKDEREKLGRKRGLDIFSGKIRCGHCGGWYGAKVWHSNDRYRRVIYQCGQKYKGARKCGSPHLTDDELKTLILKQMNELLHDRKEILENLSMVVEMLRDTRKLEAELETLSSERDAAIKRVNQSIKEYSGDAQDSYGDRYEECLNQYEQVDANFERVAQELNAKKERCSRLEKYIRDLEKAPTLLREFDTTLFNRLVDYVIVFGKDEIRIVYKDGSER